ncbi:hypothetical protein P154DRAFT_529754 [Amniculicola lignicola CBS 123094]|uniref:Uncharacterized protein n=1 Tax=Amniculicola lignicola CBS 123094 TaxID=1392246 RepID=A0A6A5X2W3_9PLEO|nr:hypothetical protein P154DRAFT_529754 [Amniculicola lignicola CBS 123094]
MRTSKALLSLSIAAGTLADPAPQPKIGGIEYWGSACPNGGLSAAIGPVNTTTNTALLTFTLSNFAPTMGSFGSTLRMCDIVSQVTIDKGWKVQLNARGTSAQGTSDLPSNATMYLRSSYRFMETAEIQSIGMLEVGGPLNGQVTKQLTPEKGDKGIVSSCAGGELDVEFQARAVEDDYGLDMAKRQAADGKSWTLTTDVDILPC